MECSLPPIFKQYIEIEKAALLKLPEVLSKQKNKFLIAINKHSADNNWSKEDDEFVKKVMEDLNPFVIPTISYSSLFWDDSEATDKVKQTIKNNATFLLTEYLKCAKIVCLAFSGTHAGQVSTAMEYVLTHARRFGDTSQPLFDTNVSSEEIKPQNNITFTDPSPSSFTASKFMKRIVQLINDLQISYNETKYRMLNTNVTYVTLLMLRRLVKNEAEFLAAMKRIQTHDNYVKLCPWPLENQLPKSDTSKLLEFTLRNCAHLAIHAYLNVHDETTKRVLQGTCVQYMKWRGLQLPQLFFKVIEIYEIEAGELWDRLRFEKTAKSLCLLADVYYTKNENLKENPSKTQDWFPYCRVLNGYYHRDLSASENELLCFILAYVVDLKIGFDKSTIRLSHWAKKLEVRPWSKSAKEIAKTIYEKYSSI